LAVPAAQPRQRRGRGSEQLASARGLACWSSLAFGSLRETCDRGGDLRGAGDRVALALGGDEHGGELAERREAERSAVRELLRVEGLVVVVAHGPYRVVIGHEGLHDHAARRAVAAGASGHLGEQLEGALGG